MKTIHIFLALFIFPFLLSSQIVFTTPSRSQVYDGYSNASEWDYRKRDALTDLRYKANKTAIEQAEYEKVMGDAYFNKAFFNGTIFYDNKVTTKKYTLRYNALSDDIEINSNGTIVYLVKDKKISCLIGNQKYVYRPFIKNENEGVRMGFLKVLYEGNNFTLYQRNIKKYKPAKKAKNSFDSARPAKLVDFTYYYFTENKGIATLLKQKKKAIMSKIASDKKSKMAQFIKNNNIDLKSQTGLVLFFKHYDSLTKKQ